MHVPPPNSQLLPMMRRLLVVKRFEEISQMTDITEQVKKLGIAEKILLFMKRQPLPGFNASGKPDDYRYYAQIGKFPPNCGMEIYTQKPHVTIICERTHGDMGVRAMSINPRDYSFGPDISVTLTQEQFDSLKALLAEHFEDLDVLTLLKFESLN